ncbi:hypothetical protein TI05_02040 [Achromatium sp. WMS3]|nr:hypothetical protein TI05_02040 [Achromatium sp. WMS3]
MSVTANRKATELPVKIDMMSSTNHFQGDILEETQKKMNGKKLIQAMKEFSDEATKNGMTDEILDGILNEKDRRVLIAHHKKLNGTRCAPYNEKRLKVFA